MNSLSLHEKILIKEIFGSFPYITSKLLALETFIDADQEDSVGGNMPYCQTNNILEYLFPGREMVINHVQ